MNLRTAMKRFKSFYGNRKDPKKLKRVYRKRKHVLAGKYARVRWKKRQREERDRAWNDRPFSRDRRSEAEKPAKKKKKVDSFRRPTRGWFD